MSISGKVFRLSYCLLMAFFVAVTVLQASQLPEGPQVPLMRVTDEPHNCDFPYKGAQEVQLMATDEFPADVDCEVDLEKNRIGIRNQQAIKAHNGPFNGQGVVRLTLDPKTTEVCRARIEVLFGETLKDWNLNIADSVSNNGYSGDSGHQSHDGEAQILNGNFALYGDDHMPADEKNGKVLSSAEGLGSPGATVIFEVSNNRLVWQNDRGLDGEVKSPYIFCLAGQPDTEGPVNHDIFIGLNQVINGDRTGCGVKRVRIKLFHE